MLHVFNQRVGSDHLASLMSEKIARFCEHLFFETLEAAGHGSRYFLVRQESVDGDDFLQQVLIYYTVSAVEQYFSEKCLSDDIHHAAKNLRLKL